MCRRVGSAWDRKSKTITREILRELEQVAGGPPLASECASPSQPPLPDVTEMVRFSLCNLSFKQEDLQDRGSCPVPLKGGSV